MSHPSLTLDYDEIAATLQCARIPMNAAEFHGYVVGQYCSGSSTGSDQWLQLFVQSTAPGQVIEVEDLNFLRKTRESIWQDMIGSEFAFQLVIPSDDEGIAERALALRDWCRGFLSGFGEGGAQPKLKSQPDLREALSDIEQMTRVDVVPIQTEENEKYIVELIEYLRIAVLNIFVEIADPGVNPATSGPKLH
ncbi:MAG: UPF0149 family protein [Pseudomonadota bacterium]